VLACSPPRPSMEDNDEEPQSNEEEEEEVRPRRSMERRGSQSSIDMARAALANAPRRNSGTKLFMFSGNVNRQQMIEYLSLLRWSQATWVSAPYSILLWATVVTIINYRANSIASYEVRSGVIQSLRDIQAVPTRGVAPAEVQVGKDLGLQQGGSSCSCTCAVFRSDLCETAEPERRHDFQGTISLGHIAELRAQAAYFQDGVDGNVSWNGLRWDDIRSRDDVLMWLQHGLLPVLWNEVGRDTPVHVGNMFDSNAESILADRANPGIFNHWMQIVGGVRMRQRRLQSVPCHGIDARLQERYSPNCYSDILQVQPYGPGLGSIAEGFVPQEEGVLGAYDVRLNLGTPFREILENFEYMLKYHNWIDDASHSLQIQAAMVHGEATPPFFVMFEVRFDFRRSGFVAKDLNIFLTATDMFPTTLEIVLHVLWALMLFSLLFSQSFKTISTFLSKRKRKLFVADLRFISDWVVIIYSLFIVGFFIVVQQSVWDLSAMVQELPTYSSSANSEQMDTYQQSWTSILDSVDMAAFYFDYFRVALFWYTLVIATQFSKIFAGQPKLAQLMSAFTHASEDLLHFSLLFFVLFISFAIGGFMIWGMVMEEWSTPGKALNSTLRALLGNVNLSEMFFYSQFGTAVWYSAFFVSMLIITLNLLVAMVYDHYTIIKARAGAVSGVLEQLHWVGKDLASRLKGMSCMSKLTCCCRRAVRQIPEQKVLLEMFMERANLPTYEKAMIHTTVLGARWMRKERERSVFSGQDTSLDVAVNDPVGPDLANANMDQGYAEELAEHCKAFSDAAYDPEDARISQLRQLVATAEDEIVEMRLRLQACAEYSRASMHTLTRRIDSLEVLVHNTLAELVTIANEAGVPTGGKAKRAGAVTSPVAGAVPAQTGLTGAMGRRQESKSEVDMVKKWHKATRSVNKRAGRAAAPANAKFFGPR